MVSNKIYNGPVLIKTKSGSFDCVGIIKKTDTFKFNKDNKIYYEVKVLAYINGNYSKKDQRYYLSEIKDILTEINQNTVSLLYTGD